MSAKVGGKAILYGRVSTAEQASSGLGLAAQREALEAEARHRGWPTVEWASDDGVSGSVDADKRPTLAPVLDALGPGDVLAVAKLDRLSRSVHDFSGLLRRAQEEGWGIVCLDPAIDTTTPNGRLVVHVLMAVSEWERDIISERIKAALAQSSKRLGRRPGLPPVGAAARGPEPIAPEALAVVRDAAAEGLSPRAIANRLNEYGLPSARGKRWHRESVRRLILRMES